MLFYNNDSTLDYGGMYTFGAAAGYNSGQGACPDGWHLPSPGEYAELIEHLTTQGCS